MGRICWDGLMEVLGGGPADRDDFCLWMQGVCDPSLNIHTHTSTHTPTNPLQHNLGGRRNAGIAQGGSKGAQLSLALSARHHSPRFPAHLSSCRQQVSGIPPTRSCFPNRRGNRTLRRHKDARTHRRGISLPHTKLPHEGQFQRVSFK